MYHDLVFCPLSYKPLLLELVKTSQIPFKKPRLLTDIYTCVNTKSQILNQFDAVIPTGCVTHT